MVLLFKWNFSLLTWNLSLLTLVFCFTADRKVRKEVMESKSKVLTCSKCSKTFKHKQSLSRHKNIHHGTKSFSCEKCNKYFKWKDALKEHCSSCKGPKERLCKICGKQFPYQWNLKRHIGQNNIIKIYWLVKNVVNNMKDLATLNHIPVLVQKI